ncbi:unnamed protein product [Linum trigynum]
MELEIKDGICQLVLRMHRLYQHMEGASIKPNNDNATPLRSEVWVISVRLEGGSGDHGNNSKMEIKEIKREALTTSSSSDRGHKHKKFDWEKSLRRSSSSSPPTASTGGYSATIAGSGQLLRRGRRHGNLDRDDDVVKVKKSGWKY